MDESWFDVAKQLLTPDEELKRLLKFTEIEMVADELHKDVESR